MRQGHPASFRDPAARIVVENGRLFREVFAEGADDLELLHESGLYAKLVAEKLLVRHEEAPGRDGVHRVLTPEIIPSVSYPYEWSFSQLQEAALLTLRILEIALDHGITLKDASAYNVQFRGSEPVFIDTCSFARYPEGEPWVAYAQFCRHFLAPLALMARKDVRLGTMLRDHVDGIPLDLAARILGPRGRTRPGLLLHLYLHAKAGRRANAQRDVRAKVTKNGLRGILGSLRRTIAGLRIAPQSGWTNYYADCTYSAASLGMKRDAVRRLVDVSPARLVWDLGANTGEFARAIARSDRLVVAFDADASVVELSHREAKKADANVLSLVMDIANPSPGLGWAGEERASLAARGPADLVLALALVHHLVLVAGVPLEKVAAHLAGLAPLLIIELVPEHDPQVERLRQSRPRGHPYDAARFREAFDVHFETLQEIPVEGTARTLLHLRRRRV